jgi:hypothetical protein
MLINSTQALKNCLRNGPYAWPGGYPMYFVADDGEALSFAAVKEHYRLVLASTKYRLKDGWGVIAVAINWEDQDLMCSHTGELIPSAY